MSNRLTETVFTLFAERPTAAILMSGTGSNARAILDDEEVRDLYNITTIVTDNPESNARRLAEEFKLEIIESRADTIKDAHERTAYFSQLGRFLTEKNVRVSLYAGFMKIVSPQFCATFPGINVHPADLTVLDSRGVAKYRGMQALDMMRNELGYVRSSVHVVDNPVDTGSVISLSDPLYPEAGQTNEEVHSMLKSREHQAYTKTLKMMGHGRLDISQIPLNLGMAGE